MTAAAPTATSASGREGATSLAWGSGDAMLGTPFRELVSTTQTKGGLSILAADLGVDEAVPEHTHEDEDQILVVITGEVLMTRGEERLVLTDGAVGLVPRGIPHSLRNLGTQPARVLDLYTPGGFEQVLRDAGERASAADGPPPPTTTTRAGGRGAGWPR